MRCTEIHSKKKKNEREIVTLTVFRDVSQEG